MCRSLGLPSRALPGAQQRHLIGWRRAHAPLGDLQQAQYELCCAAHTEGLSARPAAPQRAGRRPRPAERPRRAPQGRVLYAGTPLEVERLCGRLLALGVAAAGFDTEWRVTFRAGEPPRRTAVIQLCYQAGAPARTPTLPPHQRARRLALPVLPAPARRPARSAAARASGCGDARPLLDAVWSAPPASWCRWPPCRP